VNKTAACAVQFAKGILLHAYSRTTAAPSFARTNKNSYSLFLELTLKYFWL